MHVMKELMDMRFLPCFITVSFMVAFVGGQVYTNKIPMDDVLDNLNRAISPIPDIISRMYDAILTLVVVHPYWCSLYIVSIATLTYCKEKIQSSVNLT